MLHARILRRELRTTKMWRGMSSGTSACSLFMFIVYLLCRIEHRARSILNNWLAQKAHLVPGTRKTFCSGRNDILNTVTLHPHLCARSALRAHACAFLSLWRQRKSVFLNNRWWEIFFSAADCSHNAQNEPEQCYFKIYCKYYIEYARVQRAMSQSTWFILLSEPS